MSSNPDKNNKSLIQRYTAYEIHYTSVEENENNGHIKISWRHSILKEAKELKIKIFRLI